MQFITKQHMGQVIVLTRPTISQRHKQLLEESATKMETTRELVSCLFIALLTLPGSISARKLRVCHAVWKREGGGAGVCVCVCVYVHV